MKEKPGGKGKGWREPADPTCIGKDGKTKARKHHEVALKKEAGEANNTPMERKSKTKEAEFEGETEEEVVVFQHEKPIPDGLLGKFCKEFNTELNEDENREKISTKRKDAGSLQEFMSEHGIELEEIEDREMEKVHLSTAEQVVAEVQRQRKESAKAKDNSKTAKNIGDKADASALVDWVKNPAKSDLESVDTKE